MNRALRIALAPLLAVGVALLAGCGAPPPPVAPSSPVPTSELPYLVDPLSGLASAPPERVVQTLRAGHAALVTRGDLVAAAAAANDLLASDPNLAPAQVLAAEVDLLRPDYAAAQARLEPVAATNPGYTAAWLVLARAAEELGDVPAAFRAYRAIAAASPLAASRAPELRERAIEITVTRFREALAAGRAPAADAQLELLRHWSVDDELRLGLERDLAAARGDRVAELAAVQGLQRRHPDDETLALRRSELEVEVGDPGEALRILQGLQKEHPGDPELPPRLDAARFAWRLQMLPREVRDLASAPVIDRGGLATLLYWLLPQVRRGQGAGGRIASDILEHPQREAIVRVLNMGLLDVDETLHRFAPERPARRGEALEAVVRLMATAAPRPACIGTAPIWTNPSSDTVCALAAGCGLLPEPADCLPGSPLTGPDAVRLLRGALEHLGER